MNDVCSLLVLIVIAPPKACDDTLRVGDGYAFEVNVTVDVPVRPRLSVTVDVIVIVPDTWITALVNKLAVEVEIVLLPALTVVERLMIVLPYDPNAFRVTNVEVTPAMYNEL